VPVVCIIGGGIGFEPSRRGQREGRGIGDDGRFIATDVEAEELAGWGPRPSPSPSPDLEDAKINRIILVKCAAATQSQERGKYCIIAALFLMDVIKLNRL